MTLAEINPLGELQDGSFVALDAHMDMENEARAAPERAARGPWRRRRGDAPGPRADPFELAGEEVDARTTAASPGNVTEFDGNLGLVIGAGGGSLTLFDAVRAHRPPSARAAVMTISSGPVGNRPSTTIGRSMST